MMSLETIHQLARAQARKARRAGVELKALVLSDLESYRTVVSNGHYPRLPFPNIGTMKPKGWKLVRKLFVDKSGFGAEDEPAITVRSLILKELREDRAYAIIEEGQFQLYLGEFVAKEKKS